MNNKSGWNKLSKNINPNKNQKANKTEQSIKRNVYGGCDEDCSDDGQ